MFKDFKTKVKTFLIGEPVTDEYFMYAYKIITVTNEEYKCNMGYYTIHSFKKWVDYDLLDDKSVVVPGGKVINREAIKEVELLKIMDSFKYTRGDSLRSYKGPIVFMEEAEQIRDKNDW